jgi:hypothetical protein
MGPAIVWPGPCRVKSYTQAILVPIVEVQASAYLDAVFESKHIC